MTIPDPTDEIRAIRQALAAKFDNDLHRIAEDIRRQQRESGRTYITLPRRIPRTNSTTNQVMHPSGEVGTGPADHVIDMFCRL